MVSAPVTDTRGLLMVAGVTMTVLVLGLAVFLVVRRRQAMEDVDVLTSWEAFRAPATQVKPMPDLPSVDATEEVVAEMGDEDTDEADEG